MPPELTLVRAAIGLTEDNGVLNKRISNVVKHSTYNRTPIKGLHHVFDMLSYFIEPLQS